MNLIYRTKQGLSQEDFAFYAGLNMNSISTLERGINNVKIIALYAIAQALYIDIYDFFKFKL